MRSEIPREFRNVAEEKDGEDGWADQVKHEEVLQSQTGKEYSTHSETGEGSWNAHILCKSGLLKHIIEGKA